MKRLIVCSFVFSALTAGNTVFAQPIEDLGKITINPTKEVRGGASSTDAIPDVDGGSLFTTGDNTEEEYRIGVGDILEIAVLQPEKLQSELSVSPSGNISFPYIGTLKVLGKTPGELEQDITSRLSNGFMNYPVVTVGLKESRSRKFFVYGEVVHPGGYPLEADATVMRAISMAGGFTKFGSASSIRLLRPRKGNKGYEPIKISIKEIVDGNPNSDINLKAGDIVVVTEGIF